MGGQKREVERTREGQKWEGGELWEDQKWEETEGGNMRQQMKDAPTEPSQVNLVK